MRLAPLDQLFNVPSQIVVLGIHCPLPGVSLQSGGQGEAEVGQQEERLRDGGGEDTRTVRHRPLVKRVAGVTKNIGKDRLWHLAQILAFYV